MDNGKIKTYKMGESELLTDKTELKLDKLKAYMVDTGRLTGIHLLPTNISKNKPKRISKEDRAKMTTTEKQMEKQAKKEYANYLKNVKNSHYIEITQNWLQLCVYMLGTIESNEKERFIMTLVEHDVMSSGFNITKELVERADSENKYYRIPKTDYYLDTNLRGLDVVKAIKNMAKVLQLDKKGELSFNIEAIK